MHIKIYTLLIKYVNKFYELVHETPYAISDHRGFSCSPEVLSLLKTSISIPEWIPFKSSGTVVLSQIELPNLNPADFKTTHNPLSHILQHIPSVIFQPTHSMLAPQSIIEVSGFSKFASQRDLNITIKGTK